MSTPKQNTFIFLGDSHYGRRPGERSDYELWGKLLRTACEKAFGGAEPANPLLVLGGDLVNKPDREDEWEMFFAAGGETLRRMQVITATGNRRQNHPVSYEDRFDLPANGPAGFEQKFYSCDHGNCHFIMLDSNLMDESHEDLAPLIRDWIRKDLEVLRREHPEAAVFALQHHPMVTVGTSQEDERRARYMRRTYLPLLEEYRVDMILCGHQHLYCRSKPIAGLIQIMGVSGTKFFEGWELSQMECVREYTSVATIFDVTGTKIRLRTIDGSGNILDEATRPIRIE